MSDELLPCPFCGGEASLDHHAGVRYSVACDTIGCNAGTGGPNCVEQWNRRSTPPPAVGLTEKQDRHPMAPGQCPDCKWSNTNLMNYGTPETGSIWLCHGCAGRRIRGESPIEPTTPPAGDRVLTVGEALLDERVADGSHVVRCRLDGVTIEMRGAKGWRLAWRRVYPEGIASAWQFNIDAGDMRARCDVVPYVENHAPTPPEGKAESLPGEG